MSNYDPIIAFEIGRSIGRTEFKNILSKRLHDKLLRDDEFDQSDQDCFVRNTITLINDIDYELKADNSKG